MRSGAGLINSRLANNLTGIATIKSFTAERYELAQVNRESEAYRQSNKQAIALSAAFIPILSHHYSRWVYRYYSFMVAWLPPMAG